MLFSLCIRLHSFAYINENNILSIHTQVFGLFWNRAELKWSSLNSFQLEHTNELVGERGVFIMQPVFEDNEVEHAFDSHCKTFEAFIYIVATSMSSLILTSDDYRRQTSGVRGNGENHTNNANKLLKRYATPIIRLQVKVTFN